MGTLPFAHHSLWCYVKRFGRGLGMFYLTVKHLYVRVSPGVINLSANEGI